MRLSFATSVLSLVLLLCVWSCPAVSFVTSTKTNALSPTVPLSPNVALPQRAGRTPGFVSPTPTRGATPTLASSVSTICGSNAAASSCGRLDIQAYATTVTAQPRNSSTLGSYDSSANSTSSLRGPSTLNSHQTDSPAGTWRTAEDISSLTSSTAVPVYDIEKIRQILPHRFPFLLLDKVLSFEAGKRAVGVKQVTANEDQFNGHFPSRSILPGVLQVEALAQLAGIVALQPPISDGKGDFFFAGVNGVRWKKPVVPGDTLVMEVELTAWKEKLRIVKAKGKAYVDGKPAIEVEEMMFALVRPRVDGDLRHPIRDQPRYSSNRCEWR
ncbi:3-hydroxyacyl-[acyl-carrier-protein] dehydratase FabZ-like [Ochotona princeps]|uniref:3-hydroxyacyl-[acyl-carrier-protein] dehydratase FabZ-like n=1 Tax=Ochotona princeps TaxID=9978 RepID=UPI0027149946|nr:3-hydroxyacyl-[acyl-carrier-protein] dehydratase FabZ-like [Ochotona princeps]